MKKAVVINQSEVKRLLKYCPESGLFTWAIKPSAGVDCGNVAGTKNTQGYISILIKRKSYKAHRLAWLYMTGHIPNWVDHVNGVRDDNRWVNLRECTPQQNAINAKLRKDSSSGVKGVYWHATTKKWTAQANCKGKRVHLGRFSSIEEAIIAREKYVKDNFDLRFYREN
ncbi:HNH endonuclease signature motif containing protein [Serratia sp. UGAL515B_01]|uniref:HNH endonuclease signature motif containing protein n=1 Tax=Serratia sp. UGAL515B_01 TaxID=2986763 RepID=UPI002952E9ED|nr:HNH endonuclease signature motif containing protein [Serratia sp. UGAL515B_01]WON77812.1 HNH endonuclease [Serratia sp. UGAL515B_01]